jgi:hypothetical protein
LPLKQAPLQVKSGFLQTRFLGCGLDFDSMISTNY